MQPQSATPAAVTPTAVPTAEGPINGKITVDLDAPQGRCDPEKVRVVPSVPDGQFVGGPVPVRLAISTTQDSACIFDPKIADLLVVISANEAPVWDNILCDDPLLSGPIAITPQWSTVANATWSGRGSGQDCASKEKFASPGTYVIRSAAIGGEPGKDTFTLVAPQKGNGETD